MSFLTRAVVLLASLAQLCVAGYTLQDDYSPDNFFSMWEFFTAPDPTHGFVNYVDQGTAQAAGLISTSANSITMGVDSTNIAPNGRNSVRLTSNKVYNHGLIILDVAHMPEGCGTWPAFWTVGPSWPNNGEIDIIEGVNDQISNAMTLHTGPSCGITNNGLFAGDIITPSCDVAAFDQPTNAGCSIKSQDETTYGTGLNAIKGGVYATEWTSEAISIYFFPRTAIPEDITSGKPTPSSWGKPLAQFQGGCDIDSNIKDQQIVFDTTFCGDWAGNVWSQSSTCSAKAYSCEDYVANNPSAFANAYWEINSLKVYEDDGLAGPEPPVASTDAGPTGIATDLPSQLSSLAPIPISSHDIQTTFIVSVKPTSTLVSSQPAQTSVAIPTSVVVPSSEPAPVPSSSVKPPAVSAGIPHPSVVVPQDTSAVITPVTSAVIPSVTSAVIPPVTSTVMPPVTSAAIPPVSSTEPSPSVVLPPEPVTTVQLTTTELDEPCDGSPTDEPVVSSAPVYTPAVSLPIAPSPPVYSLASSVVSAVVPSVEPAPVYSPEVSPVVSPQPSVEPSLIPSAPVYSAPVYTPVASTPAAPVISTPAAPTYAPALDSSANQGDPQIANPDPQPEEYIEGEPLLASWFPDGDDTGGIPEDVMPEDWEDTHRRLKRHPHVYAKPEPLEPLLLVHFPSHNKHGGIPAKMHEVSSERTRRFERRMVARNAKNLRHAHLHKAKAV